MRRVSWIPALIALAALGAPLPMAAATVGVTCAVGADLEEAVEAAPIVFVGTVTEEDPKGGIAFVSVEEVWSGGEMPPSVLVMNVMPAGDGFLLTPGKRYLFIPDGPGEPFATSCMGPMPMSDEIEALRPEEVGTPGAAPEAPAEPAIDVIGRFALPAFILVAIAVSIAAFTVKGPAPS